MPGLDGTGPRGRGPMTGGGRGFCLLREPSKANEAVTGFAGLSGRPVSGCPLRPSMELAWLRARVDQLQTVLRAMRDRSGRHSAFSATATLQDAPDHYVRQEREGEHQQQA
jgi:Family of unknown function (DUF5320)